MFLMAVAILFFEAAGNARTGAPFCRTRVAQRGFGLNLGEQTGLGCRCSNDQDSCEGDQELQTSGESTCTRHSGFTHGAYCAGRLDAQTILLKLGFDVQVDTICEVDPMTYKFLDQEAHKSERKAWTAWIAGSGGVALGTIAMLFTKRRQRPVAGDAEDEACTTSEDVVTVCVSDQLRDH